MGGTYEGETGSVVAIDPSGGVVTVFSDIASREFRVLSHDLVECSDVASGRVRLGVYELHDLVQLT
jgi:transcription elongation factor